MRPVAARPRLLPTLCALLLLCCRPAAPNDSTVLAPAAFAGKRFIFTRLRGDKKLDMNISLSWQLEAEHDACDADTIDAAPPGGPTAVVLEVRRAEPPRPAPT